MWVSIFPQQPIQLLHFVTFFTSSWWVDRMSKINTSHSSWKLKEIGLTKEAGKRSNYIYFPAFTNEPHYCCNFVCSSLKMKRLSVPQNSIWRFSLIKNVYHRNMTQLPLSNLLKYNFGFWLIIKSVHNIQYPKKIWGKSLKVYRKSKSKYSFFQVPQTTLGAS